MLDPAGLLLEFDEDRPDSCLKLVSAASQGLCSIGGYDVFLRVDEQWRRLA